MKINQTKIEVHDTYKKDEKIPRNFETSVEEDVIKKEF